MTIARSEVVVEGEVGVYHVVSRCVRRAFLCGWDSFSGRNLDYRKEWVRERLIALSDIFAVEVVGYAVMANHTHQIIRTRPDLAKEWEAIDVAERWLTLFPKRLTKEGLPAKPNAAEVAALIADEEKLQTYRERLSSLSWFMRCINEHIAKMANKEDDCTGRFWEGRFKCQHLLDEAAILACMAYVDLNPIRAKVAETPEKSEYTSGKDRIDSRQAKKKIRQLSATRKANEAAGKTPLNKVQQKLLAEEQQRKQADRWLAALKPKKSDAILSLSLDDYLDLLDWTGRQIKEGKRGSIPKHLSPILTRLQIDTTRWVETVLSFGSLFHRVAGKVDAIIEAARRAGRKWLKGMGASQTAFPTKAPT